MKSRRLDVSTSMNGRVNSLMIPMDLIVEIFSWLPAKTIARFRFLSKRWASILELAYFKDLFLTKSFSRPQVLISWQRDNKVFFYSLPQPRNPDENTLALVANYLTSFPSSSEVLGPINGLVCLRRELMLKDRMRPVSVLVICNPTTGEFLPLLKMKTRRREGLKSFIVYDPIEKQFKVLSMTWLVHGRNRVFEEYQVLTVGTRKQSSWRMIKCCIPHFSKHKGICINGVLYYTAAANTDSKVPMMIVCFDVRSEKFRFIQLLENLRYGTLINYKGKLGSLLSNGNSYHVNRRSGSISYEFNQMSTSITLCVLENVENQEWSTHVYALPALWRHLVIGHRYLTFVGVTWTNEIVLSALSFSPPHAYYLVFFYYNIEKKTVVKLQIQGEIEFTSDGSTFVDHDSDETLDRKEGLDSSF